MSEKRITVHLSPAMLRALWTLRIHRFTVVSPDGADVKWLAHRDCVELRVTDGHEDLPS